MESGRTDSYTVREINLVEERENEIIKSLIQSIIREFGRQLGISNSDVDVEVTVHQQPPRCWGFRGITGDEGRDLAYDQGITITGITAGQNAQKDLGR